MSPQALENCLSTREREHAGLTLGVVTPGACGEPPFDADPPRLELWAWPWTEWPLFDRIALERDRARIERWYAARGFHHAEVEGVHVVPAQAAEDDTLPKDDPNPGCERIDDDEGCEAEVVIEVEEGQPTIVDAIEITGLEPLPEPLPERVREAVELEEGERFDEALYDRSKDNIRDLLGREGYALVEVQGVARVHRPDRAAWISFAVEPGPEAVFGDVIVEGNGYLPAEPIAEAVLIEPGDPYDFDEIVDAQRAIRELGSFAGVTVEPVLPEEGNVVDVRVTVTPAREDSFALGVGVQAGELKSRTESISIPQWDVHLIGRYRNRNLFGGLRQLTIEERPRLVFQSEFPQPGRLGWGNTAVAELRQPGFLEPRTTGDVSLSHTFGPDPFDVFFRHRVDTELGIERQFFEGHLYARLAIHNMVYRLPSGEQRFDGSHPPTDSHVTFPEQILRLDFRDDETRPHGGAFLQLAVQEAGYWLPSDWDYVRVLPDARVYVPLPARITIAARFAVGMLFVMRADRDLGPLQRALGPRDYRLRGGGASSNRGFLPGRLGDGIEGGARRWEASPELRLPILTDLGLALFGDMGDVNREEEFRFDHPQTSAGFGLRYYTIVGAIRADFAWQIPAAQVLAQDDGRIRDLSKNGEPRAHGGPFAFHLTIGQPF